MASEQAVPVAPDEQHNEVRLRGRVSGDPERRRLPSGDEVVRLRVVLTRADGVADAIPVQVGPAPGPGGRARPGQTGRRHLADAERLTTGTVVNVEGRLQRRWWQAGSGRRSQLEVVATTLVSAGGRVCDKRVPEQRAAPSDAGS